MGADPADRGRGDAVADPCRLAARPRRGDRQEAGLSQRRLQRHHARQPLLPGGKRVHADFRPDAQRQSGAWLALSVRRLYRLRHQHLDRLLGARLHRRVSRRGAGRRRPADRRLPPHGGAGSAPDHGHDRALDRVCGPDAVGVRRRFLSDPDPELAGRPDRIAAGHRGQIVGRGGLSAVPDGAAGDLRSCGRDRHRDVAGAQSNPRRDDGARRRR